MFERFLVTFMFVTYLTSCNNFRRRELRVNNLTCALVKVWTFGSVLLHTLLGYVYVVLFVKAVFRAWCL